MSKILILDDELPRHAGFKKLLPTHQLTHVFTCARAISFAQSELYDVMLLDHDLHDVEDGRDFCKWLTTNSDRCPKKILIHSWNGWRATEMVDELLTLPFTISLVNRPIPAFLEEPPDSRAVPRCEEDRIRTEYLVNNFIALLSGLIDS